MHGRSRGAHAVAAGADWLSYIFLALALSLDSFTVGLVYALRGLRLNWAGLLVVSATSMAVLGGAMLLGQGLAAGLAPPAARRAGAAILVGVGVWVLWQARSLRGRGVPAAPAGGGAADGAPVWRLRLPLLRVVVMILREPAAADLDRSGSISPAEAFFLGLALAADSLGAGLGAGLADFPPLLLAVLVGGAGWVSLALAAQIANRVPDRLSGRWELVHGLVLVALGLYRMW